MSIMTESNVYESMVDDGLNEKLCLTATCDSSGAFVFVPKIEDNATNVMLDASESKEDDAARLFKDGAVGDAYNGATEPPVYYEGALSACEEVEVDYKPTPASMMLPAAEMDDQWDKSDRFQCSAADMPFEEQRAETSYSKGFGNNDDDSDEETIATFLTSAGQRLALYAVEDSDEVFAVAVYDESGEPPTNFQFLMKSDVERLIGEGAVRTVKKPKPVKKQTLNADPPVFTQPVEHSNSSERQLKTERPEIAEYDDDLDETRETTSRPDGNVSTNIKSVRETNIKPSPAPDADVQPDFTYVLMEDTHPTSDGPNRTEEMPKPAETSVPTDSMELIEQSTVQRILYGDDDSDGELTLADVEKTLTNHQFRGREKSLLKKKSITNSPTTEINRPTNVVSPPDPKKSSPLSSPSDSQNFDDNVAIRRNLSTKLRKTSSPARRTTNSLIRKRDGTTIDERTFAGTSILVPKKLDEKISTKTITSSETSQIISRVKRSRKQQLTSVNRDDSEIIIQPANFMSDEDDEPTKKRGRGRRKIGRPTVCRTKNVVVRRTTTRTRRSTPVEVIEIDVDEADRLQERSDIVEITIDGNKEKCSSDKENEIIMVGDSEDEERPDETTNGTTTNLKCRHCSRNFRQKRGLETHARCCPKSPNYGSRKSGKTKRRSAETADDSEIVKKQYACKICGAKFDVVVALATHVRSMHSMRKKADSRARARARSGGGTPESASLVGSRGRTTTRIKTSNRLWKSKELHCEDCGRWFSSEALLTAHSLQHATKKSEKQTRRCLMCKKLFKSRLLYIRHMRMHSRAKQLQKKLHQTHQTTGKSTALRKRGRPRKL